MWVAKYGDIEKDIEAVDDAPEAMEKVELEYGREACERNVGYKGIEDEDIDDGDASKTEERSDFEEDVELTEEDKLVVFEHLHGVLAMQGMEAQELLSHLENAGCGQEDNETPEDWAFGE